MEYCEPVIKKRVTEHYLYNPEYPLNYRWPEQVSYLNPITALKIESGVLYFKLLSGEKTDNTVGDDRFNELNWSQITFLVIRLHTKDSYVSGFEFYN